jgi:hypothetical protein
MQSLAAHSLFEGLARHDGQSNKDSFASIAGVVANGGLTVAKTKVQKICSFVMTTGSKH